jgi:methyl-accepting chemotaxis protein
MKLSHRLAILTVSALLGMVLLGALALYSIHSSMNEDRRSQISNLLLMSESLVKHYQGLEASGKLTREQAQAQAAEALSTLDNAGKSYILAREPSGLLRVHPNAKLVGTIPQSQARTYDGRPDGEAYADAMQAAHVGFVTLLVRRPGGEDLIPKLNGVVNFPAWNWWIGTGFFTDDIDTAFWRQARLFAMVSLAAALVIALLSWRMGRSILRLLGGEPAYAASVTERIAQGDLTGRVELRTGDEHSLLRAMSAMQANLAGTVARIRASVDLIDTGAHEIAAGNHDLSQRTEQQASSLQQTAQAMEQLTSTVEHNADNAREARQLAMDASEVAQRGSATFVRLVENMDGISASSKKVTDIISVIDGIAFQTNILALNAAVEAARAGEQGRGFAVVAGEVRTLAQRSATAAREIKGLIEDSTARIEGGAGLVSDAGRTMEDILASVRRVATLIDGISTASTEQSKGIAQIGESVHDMDRVTQQNAALVEQAAAGASSLETQARALAEAVSAFRVDAAPALAQH